MSIPVEKTRVIISKDSEGSDYINASYINVRPYFLLLFYLSIYSLHLTIRAKYQAVIKHTFVLRAQQRTQLMIFGGWCGRITLQ